MALDEALRIAIERNPALLRATQAERAAAARVELAEGAFAPDLRLTMGPSVRYAPGASSASVGETGRRADDPFTSSITLGATSAITILDGSARSAELTRAGLEHDAARLARRRVAQEIVYRVTSAAIDVAVAGELIVVERENLEAERRQLERVEAFVGAGARPVAERFAQDAAVAAAELRLLSAERNLAAGRIALALALGVDPARPLDVVAPAPAQAGQIESAVREPLGPRADLAAQRARIAAAAEEIRIAGAGSAVSLGLTGGIGTSYSSTGLDAFGDQFGVTNPAASIGASLTLPLLDRRRSSIASELARIERELAEQALAELERQAAAQIELARLEHRTAVARLAVSDRQLEAARSALDAESARYASGSSTLAELSQVRARFVTAAAERVKAGYELVERRALLEYVTGAIAVPGLAE